jgi:hypothetical protein
MVAPLGRGCCSLSTISQFRPEQLGFAATMPDGPRITAHCLGSRARNLLAHIAVTIGEVGRLGGEVAEIGSWAGFWSGDEIKFLPPFLDLFVVL